MTEPYESPAESGRTSDWWENLLTGVLISGFAISAIGMLGQVAWIVAVAFGFLPSTHEYWNELFLVPTAVATLGLLVVVPAGILGTLTCGWKSDYD